MRCVCVCVCVLVCILYNLLQCSWLQWFCYSAFFHFNSNNATGISPINYASFPDVVKVAIAKQSFQADAGRRILRVSGTASSNQRSRDRLLR